LKEAAKEKIIIMAPNRRRDWQKKIQIFFIILYGIGIKKKKTRNYILISSTAFKLPQGRYPLSRCRILFSNQKMGIPFPLRIRKKFSPTLP
jgi:hypothetical protein